MRHEVSTSRSRSFALPGPLRAPVTAVTRRPGLVGAAQDALAVALAYPAATLLRYEGEASAQVWVGVLAFLPVVALVVVVVHRQLGLYGRVWRYASLDDAKRLLVAGATSTAVLLLLDLLPRLVPLSVVVMGGVLSTAVIGLARFQARLVAGGRRPESSDAAGLRVLVVGAGQSGAALVRQMLAHPREGLTPVGLLDDDERLHGQSLLGVPVIGCVDELAGAVEASGAHHVVLAIADPPASLVRRVADAADAAGVAVRVLPDSSELVRSGLRLQDVREVRIEDLLGRPPVATDLNAVRALLTGRRVLITGAGGSIGSEIARQVAGCSPRELLLLDHDETHVHDVMATLPQGATPLLADVRDRERLTRLFLRHRPDVVFHAAAHKHVPILEAAPSEAVRTNVLGTAHVVAAARAAGVQHLVMISTDKAVQPRSVMGASKRVAEHVVLDEARRGGEPWCAVRFGNVLGSRGSVIPTFAQQIEAGGPVTVTDARMTRFFMTIPEAVQLVLQAAALARGGEVFMLDMGEPVKIMDLAQRMVRLSGRRPGRDIEIRVTGVRPGEKLHEELQESDEVSAPTSHPSVQRLLPKLPPAEVVAHCVARLGELALRDRDDAVRPLLFAAAAEKAVPIPRTAPVVDVRGGHSGGATPSSRVLHLDERGARSVGFEGAGADDGADEFGGGRGWNRSTT